MSLAVIDKLNQDPSPTRVLGSMDVTALYPSLDAERDSKLCGSLVRKHLDKIQGVNWQETPRYLALTHTPGELEELYLTDVCHS